MRTLTHPVPQGFPCCPSAATLTLMRSSSDTQVFNGISFAYFTCRPVLIVPHPRPPPGPAGRRGLRVASLLPEPYAIMQWSSSVPFPS